jgi:hypothetical protein
MGKKNNSDMIRECFNKSKNFGKNFELSVHMLQFKIFVDPFLIFDIYVQRFRALFVPTSICYNALFKRSPEG